MTVTFVQADTAPPVLATIHDQADPTQVLNLVGATVKFQMRGANDRYYRVNAACTIVNAPGGEVSYAWAAGDLSVPGDYIVQFEVTFPSGKIQTTAVPIPITVRRQ